MWGSIWEAFKSLMFVLMTVTIALILQARADKEWDVPADEVSEIEQLQVYRALPVQKTGVQKVIR